MIERWVQLHQNELLDVENGDEILDLIWPLLTEQIRNGIFQKFDKPDVLKEVSKQWIEGKPFHSLLRTIRQRKAKMIWGTRRWDFQIDHMVEVCEGGLAYDGALLISALCEFVGFLNQEGTDDLISLLQLFQKQLKYGLPTETTITLYELGFSDRVISQDLSKSLDLSGTRRKDIIKSLKQNQDAAFTVIEKYPTYFQERINEII